MRMKEVFTGTGINWIDKRDTKLAWLDHTNDEDNAELERAWHMLLGGAEAYSEVYGERWQYMGTCWNWQGNQKWQHQFRHRAHPDRNHERYYQYIDAPEPRAELLEAAW